MSNSPWISPVNYAILIHDQANCKHDEIGLSKKSSCIELNHTYKCMFVNIVHVFLLKIN
jgi:hypothetical protein